MKVVLETPDVYVVDDFLKAETAREIWAFMQAIAYSRTNVINWAGDWRLDDGEVMRGAVYAYGPLEKSIPYPADQPIDFLFEEIFRLSEKISKRIGAKDKDWVAMSGIPMLYPRGSSLYWHRDAEVWTGSFTYYCHPTWNIHWGGELLVSEGEYAKQAPKDHGVFLQPPRKIKGLSKEASFGAHLDTKNPNRVIQEEGFGRYIMPKPNRLVILTNQVPHCVSKVDAAAGDHVRASISGFFLKPKT